LQNQLASELQTSVSSLAGSDYTYLSEVGISIQKSGQLAFDSSKFKTAFEADTGNVKKLFSNTSTDGFMDRFDSRITELLQADGLIDSREDGVRERINQAKRKQDNIEYRLELVQRRLTAQFSALDASLGQMRQAGNYLASALG
jgi:flagellar hook-associated protein 2